VQVISGEPPYNQPALPFPYMPLDAQTPPNPGNAYALSKHVGEVMLEYFARKYGLSATALRFPYLVDDGAMAWLRSKPERTGSTRGEGFTFLHMLDAAALVAAILKANLTGYRVYFPAAHDNSAHRTAEETIRNHYAGITLRKPIEEMSSLVDIAAIERATGWTPQRGSLGGSTAG
jgi:nucleoside-diphosphate-sugar epimerase